MKPISTLWLVEMTKNRKRKREKKKKKKHERENMPSLDHNNCLTQKCLGRSCSRQNRVNLNIKFVFLRLLPLGT
jgi:hypothetical protein